MITKDLKPWFIQRGSTSELLHKYLASCHEIILFLPATLGANSRLKILLIPSTK